MRSEGRTLALRANGVTAAFEVEAAGGPCLLHSLTNSRPSIATVLLRLPGGEVLCFDLRPCQKRQLYPPLVVGGGLPARPGALTMECRRGTTVVRAQTGDVSEGTESR